MELIAWRHPRPQGVAGRCIGQVDVGVDRRKAKRLAHRVRQHARRQGLFGGWQKPTVWTSPLARGRDVGRVLRRWGWAHRVDARLGELDFGRWDGQPWSAIAKPEVDAWCADFPHARPGGGEAVLQLLARCRAFVDDVSPGHAPGRIVVVGHAGWISALSWLTGQPPQALPSALSWPPPLGYSCRADFPGLGGAQPRSAACAPKKSQ